MSKKRETDYWLFFNVLAMYKAADMGNWKGFYRMTDIIEAITQERQERFGIPCPFL